MTTQFSSTSSRQELLDYDEMERGFTEASFRVTAKRSLGALPWWMISVTVHAMLLLLAFLIIIDTYEEKQKPDLLMVAVAELPEEKEKEKEEVKLEKKTEVNLKTETDVPFFTPEKIDVVEDPTEVETENEEVSEHKSKGHQDAVSTIPAEGSGTIGFFGVGGGGRAGAFGWRSGGGRKRSTMKHGGSRGSEASVDLGLEWLKKNQEPDGHWAVIKHGGKEGEKAKVGVSGLALLAFLGAGHTEKHGTYKAVVKKAQTWLMAQQDTTSTGKMEKMRGRITVEDEGRANGYNHAIAGLALAEAYGMAKNRAVGVVAQKAVDYSCNVHQDTDENGDYSGWRYGPSQGPDTSVTGWFIMQLKSARVSGLKVPGHGMLGAENWLDKVQPKKGVPYAELGIGRYDVGDEKSGSGLRMTAVCILGRLFMGYKTTNPVLIGGARHLIEQGDKLIYPRSSGVDLVDYYYIYYGTLAMFQMGGENWKIWNTRMRDPLIDKQTKAPGADLGSWNPEYGWWGKTGGRAYSTAISVLSLEVYYRYLPMNQQ